MKVLILALAFTITGCANLAPAALSDAVTYCEATNGGFTEKGQALCARLRGEQ